MNNYKIVKFIILVIFCGNIFLFFDYSNASQNIKIIVKINNSIITSEDINYEINYLKALNEDLKNLKKDEVLEIAKISLIKEKIKENEIEKYNDTIPKITAHEPPTILRLKTNLN